MFNIMQQHLKNHLVHNIGWIDISNLNAKVPIIGGSIYVKILILPSDKQNKLFNKQKLKAIELIGGVLKTKISNSNPNISSNSNLNTNSSPIKKTISSQNKVKQNNNNNNFINIQTNTKQTNKIAGNGQKVKYVPGSQTTQQRLQGFKQQQKIQNERQQHQFNAKKKFEDKINAWGYNNHKINNMTTLLATLHTLWPSWKQLSLSQLLSPQQTKKHLRKALIMLHPDKNMNKDYQTRYLSKRIFQLINQAKKQFDNNSK